MNSKEQSRREYISRINKVMDYIEQHLDEDINLNTISKIACFSPFHFHRIFTTITGETLNSFIQRLRIEKAATLLRNNEMLAISEVAIKLGFKSTSVFCRSFRKYFNLTTKEFREAEKPLLVKSGLYYSKNGQLVSKGCQLNPDSMSDFCNGKSNQFIHSKFIIMDTKIEIKEMPELQVVYVRHTGQFDQIGKAYEKLMKWAGPRGLLNFPKTKTMTVYHDDPRVTEIEKVRQSACITIENDVNTDGEIGVMKIEKGKYAVGHFKLDKTEFEKAWNTMCLWLTESGYQPGEGNPYELYHCTAEQCKETFIVDICIPVKLL